MPTSIAISFIVKHFNLCDIILLSIIFSAPIDGKPFAHGIVMQIVHTANMTAAKARAGGIHVNTCNIVLYSLKNIRHEV